MGKYIGIDVHSESCTIAVMNSAGRQLRQQVVDTQAKVLIEFLKGLAGDRYVCIEEGQLAEWLVETLELYAKEMAVVQPKAHQGHKSDAADAWALAEQLRVRAKGVYVFKPTRQYRPLREAVRTYGVAVKDMTRAKNRFRSLLRARGVANFNSSIYEPEQRSAWIRKLPAAYRRRAEWFGRQIDSMCEAHEIAQSWLKEEAEKCPEVERLQTFAGIRSNQGRPGCGPGSHTTSLQNDSAVLELLRTCRRDAGFERMEARLEPRRLATRPRQCSDARSQPQLLLTIEGGVQGSRDNCHWQAQSASRALRATSRQWDKGSPGTPDHRAPNRRGDAGDLEKEGGLRPDQAPIDQTGIAVATSFATRSAQSILSVLDAEFREEVSRSFLARFTQNESPHCRLDPLGASTRTLASKAPLGGWCPYFYGAQHFEITCRQNDTAPRAASTRHPQLAHLRRRPTDRNVMSRLKANRPFAKRWLGQRADLTLTNAPLGEASVAVPGNSVRRTEAMRLASMRVASMRASPVASMGASPRRLNGRVAPRLNTRRGPSPQCASRPVSSMRVAARRPNARRGPSPQCASPRLLNARRGPSPQCASRPASSMRVAARRLNVPRWRGSGQT